jgi:hypothetical protein
MERAAGPRLESVLKRMAAERDTSPPPLEADVLEPGEKERARALGREEDGLRGRAERLAAELATLRALLPFLPAEAGQALEKAAGHLGEAGGKLGQSLPGPALNPERAALAELMRASGLARQALEELSQMQGMRQGGTGMAMMLGRGERPGGGSPSSGMRRGRRSGGRRGTDVRNFALPGKQDHRVPKIFREEILKSLRDGYPPQYEERIKDYYQRIAE